jgi:hypothetical protein
MKRNTPNDVPSGGTYTIVDRLTRIQSSGSTFETLLNNVGRTRVAIGAVSGLDLRTEVEDWVCDAYPGDCTGVDMNIPRKINLGLSDIMHGTRMLLKIKMAKDPLVDLAEAERRGAICKTCPYNQKFAKPCSGWCPELATLVRDIIGNQGTYYDQFLHGCAICRCFLPSAIWVKLDLQCSVLDDNVKNQFKAVPNCWKICNELEAQ